MNVVIATGETCPSETDDLTPEEVQGESYEKREYWEELYASHRNREDFELYRFDWYFEVRNPFFKQILLNLLSPQKSDQILHLGCGKSNLQEQLWAEGWTNIVNVDYSSTLIGDLRRQCSTLYNGLSFVELDCSNMSQLAENSFDLIIEKGLLDSVLCNTDPQESITRVLNARCRIDYFKGQTHPWRVSTYTVRASGILFPVFVCTKT